MAPDACFRSSAQGLLRRPCDTLQKRHLIHLRLLNVLRDNVKIYILMFVTLAHLYMISTAVATHLCKESLIVGLNEVVHTFQLTHTLPIGVQRGGTATETTGSR